MLGLTLFVQVQSLLPQRLFRNLLDNASRYTPEHGEIQLRAKRRGSSVLVEVEDSGVGLSAEQMPRVFDRLWRASSDRGDGCSGLGLAIASRICQALGGQTQVSSQLGRGSCFKVELPLA
jgi:signal transduction histidine kinase